jgi:hypothetical protein
MKTNAADHTYGCRSGIQKGIRRGDLDLVHTCFEELWRTKDQRNWLMWRATTLVMEEAWQMIGEYGELLTSGSKDKEDWRRFLYRVCLATKSKDAVGLVFSVMKGYESMVNLAHSEMEEMVLWYHMALESGDEEMLSVSEDLYSTCYQMREFSEYEKKGLDALLRRTKMGGMLGDRQICLSGIILLTFRGINKDEVLDDIKVNAEKWKKEVGGSKPQMVELPWYVFDMHTQAGKIATSIFMKHSSERYHIQYEEFLRVWFFLESAKTPKHLIKVKKPEAEEVDAFDSIWWLPFVSQEIKFKDYSPKAVVNIWKTKMRDDIKGAVFWILDKREKNKQ